MRTIRVLWPLLPVAAIVALLVALGSAAPTPAPKPQKAWEDGQCKSGGFPHAMILKQEYRWRDAWLSLGPTLGEPPAPPMDDKTTVGIAVFMGFSGVLGPRVQLDAITATDSRLIIDVSGVYPPGPAPTAVSQPCLFFQVERPATPILVRARFRNTYLEVTDSPRTP